MSDEKEIVKGHHEETSPIRSRRCGLPPLRVIITLAACFVLEFSLGIQYTFGKRSTCRLASFMNFSADIMIRLFPHRLFPILSFPISPSIISNFLGSLFAFSHFAFCVVDNAHTLTHTHTHTHTHAHTHTHTQTHTTHTHTPPFVYSAHGTVVNHRKSAYRSDELSLVLSPPFRIANKA